MVKLKTIFFGVLLLTLMTVTVYGTVQKKMWVQVRGGQVRSTPSFLGKILIRLSYGDQVEVQEEKNAWARVSPVGGSREGWIHISALTKKKIVLKPGARDIKQAASSDELALAGKGFNENVEKEFKSKNRHVDYAWIDRMEGMDMSQEQIQQFLIEGELLSRGDQQ
ncbi:MAG: SH3 domain-containing protein [Deltaproteobacteria bacterium]|nr:SH3 domain-containing protein [Deltaproteobacteria bacterium]